MRNRKLFLHVLLLLFAATQINAQTLKTFQFENGKSFEIIQAEDVNGKVLRLS